MKKNLLFWLFFTITIFSFAQENNSLSLSFNNFPCVEDAVSNAFYYSIKQENERTTFVVTYDDAGINKLWIEDELVFNNTEYTFDNLKNKQEYTLKVEFKDGRSSSHSLVFTTLPIVTLNTDGEEIIKDKRIDCKFTLFDSYARTNNGISLFSQTSGIKVRGSSSSGYPKKSYSVELQDESGEEFDASLLGLRSDGDWILDAMYIDRSRMRNRLCMDIWNSYNNVPHIDKEPDANNGTRGYFVEVFLNGQYNGLYCLSEKIDRKQLKVKKDVETGGVVYKAISWSSATQFWDYDRDADTDGILWCGWESDHPGKESYAKWDLLSNFIEFVSPAVNKDDNLFAQDLEDYIHLDNVVDYILFFNAVCARDNNMKNTFFSIYNTKKDYRFFITPWDLDTTFGRDWDGTLLDKYGFSDNMVFNNGFFKRLFDVNPLGFHSKLKARWAELKENQLSVASVCKRIDDYCNLLFHSKAAERESKKWPDNFTDINQEADFMKDWYSRNFTEINKYIENVGTGIDTYHSDDLYRDLVMYIKDKQLVIDWDIAEEFQISLYNISGKKVNSIRHSSPSSVIDINVPGIYLVRLESKNNNVSAFNKKVIIE